MIFIFLRKISGSLVTDIEFFFDKLLTALFVGVKAKEKLI